MDKAMSGSVDLQKERERNLELAGKALSDARDELAAIEKRRELGQEVDQTMVERLRETIHKLEDLTK